MKYLPRILTSLAFMFIFSVISNFVITDPVIRVTSGQWPTVHDNIINIITVTLMVIALRIAIYLWRR